MPEQVTIKFDKLWSAPRYTMGTLVSYCIALPYCGIPSCHLGTNYSQGIT